MDIVLVYKWGRDPDEVFVYDDGSYKFRRDRLAASSDDVAAIVSARRTAEATGGKVIGATIGSGDVSWAMARGAETTASVDSLMPDRDDAQTARNLEQAVRGAGSFDLVVLGESRDASGVAGALAASLGIPLVASVQDFAADTDNEGCVIAHRRRGKLIETLRITTPALITVAAIEQEKTVPTMKQMLAAKKAPVMRIEAHESGDSKVSECGVRRPDLHPAQLFEGELPQAARNLVAQLRDDGIL